MLSLSAWTPIVISGQRATASDLSAAFAFGAEVQKGCTQTVFTDIASKACILASRDVSAQLRCGRRLEHEDLRPRMQQLLPHLMRESPRKEAPTARNAISTRPRRGRRIGQECPTGFLSASLSLNSRPLDKKISFKLG